MCSNNHHHDMVLCPQCDLLVVLPEWVQGTKAICPRCKTTLVTWWKEPKHQPTGYAISALFMLLIACLFPFVRMNVAGIGSEITLSQIPQVLFNEDYASIGTFFSALCSTGACILYGSGYPVVPGRCYLSEDESLVGPGAISDEKLVYG